MADVKMNDFSSATDFAYAYTESSAGAQNKVPKASLASDIATSIQSSGTDLAKVNFGCSTIEDLRNALKVASGTLTEDGQMFTGISGVLLIAAYGSTGSYIVAIGRIPTGESSGAIVTLASVNFTLTTQWYGITKLAGIKSGETVNWSLYKLCDKP